MSVTIDRAPSAASTSEPQLRLALTPTDTGPGLLDGAWWPHSRDLTRELPSLVEALDHRWGRITRVTVNPRYWPVVPRKVAVRGHVVHVGWFDEQDPHQLLLLSYTVGRWDLLVIPPQSSDATAAHLMAAATGAEGHHLTSATLVAADEALATGKADRSQEAVWESEGGAVTSGLTDASGSARPVHGTEEDR